MDNTEPAPCEPRVHQDDDGVVCIDFSGCSRISRAAAELSNRRHRELTADQSALVLMLGNHVGRVDYSAQRYASAKEVCDVVTAMALVTRSFLQRHLARMFLMYHRPPYPVQVFADEVEARAWLLRQHHAST